MQRALGLAAWRPDDAAATFDARIALSVGAPIENRWRYVVAAV